MQRKPPDFAKLVEVIAESGAEVVIIGGLAMTVHGSDYVTTDIDFAYNRTRENVEKIASALQELHPRPEGWDPDLPFVLDAATIFNSSVLTLATDLGSLDLLGEVAGVKSFSALTSNAHEIELFGHRVRVASLEDLIRMKQAANRPKDQLHLIELKALLKEGPASE